MNRVIGVLMVVLALTLALVPLFTDCESQGRELILQDGKTRVPMKCHWTGIAEIGVALPLVVSGLLTLRKQRKEVYRSLAMIGATCGALAVLFPTYLIGVCANPMMLCHMIMLPTLAMGGILSMVVSAVLFISAREPGYRVAAVAG